MRKHSGFTLIEVMVVVVILGILASIVVPRIMSRPDEARVVKAKQDIQNIAAALDLYKLDNFTYPTTADGLEALVTKPANLAPGANWRTGGYLAKLPTDPWSKPYQYLSPGQHGEYDLYTLGADGALGGEGVSKDLGNWSTE